MKYNKIELVAPAGSPDALNAAIGEGADAVYLGLRDFNARMRAKNFSYNQFEAIVDIVQSKNKKVYLTLNTIIEQWEINKIYNLLKYVDSIKPDGVIIQDIGLIKMINFNFPDIKIHCSTQMNISSSKGVNFLSKKGVKRVILGRELSFSEIKSIRENSSIELEIFVHGSLCVSISGLCLFSSYFGGKSANKGKCTQACRRLYSNGDKKGYFFSTKDLMLLQYIPDIIDIGINALKIEGRMKNASYVSTVVKAYRYMIDNYEKNKEEAFNMASKIIENDLAREKTNYFFIDKNKNFLQNSKSGEIGKFVGTITRVEVINNNIYAYVNSDINLNQKDIIRIHSQNDNKRDSQKIEEIEKSNNQFKIKLNKKFNENDEIYLIEKNIEIKKYYNIIPNNLKKYKKHPGINKAILPDFSKNHSKNNNLFNDGLYVKINNFKDIFTTLSIKPEKIIIYLNKRNFNNLINFKNIPYKKEEIIIYLTPYLPESQESLFIDNIENLIDLGYKNFIINNLSQLNILKNKNINIIAGDFLYIFNNYSISFLIDNNINFFIPPLEISKKNLLELTENIDKTLFFITIFSNPELFRIAYNFNSIYNFNNFFDNNNNNFILNSYDNETIIISTKPFSIIDKTNELKKKGFNKFIVDFSYMNLTKSIYKKIMLNINNNQSLPETERFNWKNGFYRDMEN